MKKRIVMAVLGAGMLGAWGAGQDLAHWTGDELAAWTRGMNRCVNTRVADGVFRTEVVARDPQFVARIDRPFEGRANHYVSLRARCATGGRMQVFWTSEKYGKPTAPRCANFTLVGDGAWHDYRVQPSWLGEGKITALRLDPPDVMPQNGVFEMSDVRIFAEGEEVVTDVQDRSGVVFSVQTPQQEYATVTWRSLAMPGLCTCRFATAPDGLRHTYWFNLADSAAKRLNRPKGWQGKVYNLGVQQLLPNRPFAVEDFRLVKGTPDLPPDIGITCVQPEEAIPRTGRPLPIEIILRNYGTRPAQNLRFAFADLPKGCRVLDAAALAPAGEIAACAGWDSVGDDWRTGELPNERRFRVVLSDPGAGRHALAFTVTAEGMAARTRRAAFEVKPSLNLPKADYVPVPKPVKTGPYQIGAFAFPGWDGHEWHGVWTRAPWRKPVLGWYDETKPELVDWQIKQLVENGISFLYVDWYWCRGRRSHFHWPDALKEARYRSLIKWCVMWANHNGAGSHSLADQEKVTRCWIDEYFSMPEYLTENGMPVVSIWSAQGMERDMGPGGCRKLLDRSREIARAAGYKGIWFVAVRSPSGCTDAAFLARYKEMGFDATCVYKYMDGGDAKAPPRVDGYADFAWLAANSLRHWRELQANSPLPFLPSLTTAYDDRPWRGDKSSPVRNINARDFRRICADAKRFADETGVRQLLMGPLDEWGEGSIGYPNRELGFGMLEAVRDTFAERPTEGWPVNCAPEDVGLSVPVHPRAVYDLR